MSRSGWWIERYEAARERGLDEAQAVREASVSEAEAAVERADAAREIAELKLALEDATHGISATLAADELEAEKARATAAEAAFAKVRHETIEECARIAKAGWLSSKRTVIGDADREAELCVEIETSIRALNGGTK